MALRLIHTADWQIGKPFGNFPPDLAGELAAARLDAIDTIVRVAGDAGAGHVLVAGDVFDSEALPALTLRRALERMAAAPHIRWLLLPGNHDPARAGGVWDRVQRYGLPANVTALLDAAPVPIGGEAAVLPAPLRNEAPGSDPTAWMTSAVTAPGVARIGLAHGSIQGFGSEGDSSVQIARDRAAASGLAYLALGDWHGMREISRTTWYAGTPEPDRFPDNNPGNVLSIVIEGEGAVSVTPVRTARYHWTKIDAAVRSFADVESLDGMLKTGDAALPRTLVRLALSGSLSLSDHARLNGWCEAAAARLRHLEVHSSSVAMTAEAADFETLGGEGPLAEAAAQLARRAADASDPLNATAKLALVRLFGFAAEAEREALS
jgi:DNA repair exonuclease SbcCD nuclease subunit